MLSTHSTGTDDREAAPGQRTDASDGDAPAARQRELLALTTTATLLAAEPKLETLLQRVTDACTELTGARYGAFFYRSLDEHGETCTLYTLSGASRAGHEHLGPTRKTALLAGTFDGTGIIRIADVLQDPRYGSLAPHFGMPAGHLQVRSYLAAPVRARTGDVVGALLFGHPDPGAFTERAERLVAEFATQAATAIESARLHAALRRSQQELQRKNQELSAFIETAPIGFHWLDADGTILWANEAEAHLLGYARDEYVGRSVFDFHVDRDVMEDILARLTRGETVTQREARLRCKDGSIRDVLIDSSVLRDGGRFIHTQGFITDITARKASEQALRASHERYELVLEAANDVIWEWDVDADIVSRSENFARVFGYGPERGATESAWGRDRVHPDDWARVAASVRAAFASGATTWEDEYRLRRADGSYADVLGRARIVRDASGRVRRMIGSLMDLTDRKRAERAVRESEERFRTLANHAPVGIVLSDVNGDCLFVNEAWCAATGLTREEAWGAGWAKALHPEDRDRVASAWYESARSGTPFELEYRFLRPDGSVTWVQGNAVAYRNPEGEITGYIGSALDISAKRRQDQALRESEQLYRAIGESIDYGVWVCAPDGRNIYASESFLRLVGLTQEECSEFGWGKVLHPDDADRTIAAWQECVRRGDPWDCEQRFRGADGAWHPILARGVPVRDATGAIVAWAGINLDISRLKQVETELRDSHRRKDEFLATLAHELRNPLAPLRNGLEIMRLAAGDRMAVDQARDMMERQLQQMVRLIDDLLDLSRISRGKIELRRGIVDVAAVLHTAIQTCQPLIERSGHELLISAPPDPVLVQADATRLTQVFTNLVDNAAKYTPPGGRIRLSLARQRDEVVVRIRDSGVGIPAHMMEQVFEMFTQVDRALERPQTGLGIGLNIVKRLVEMHGGTVQAYSDGRGMGSEFIVRLPGADGATGDGPASAGAAANGSVDADAPKRRRVLVVDDNADAAASLATILKLLGSEARTAKDGIEAIEVGELFRPDVILMDIGMPRLNGFEACARIRLRDWGRDAAIIAMTGWGQDHDRERSRSAGFDHHLVKPVEPTVLESMLATLPGRPCTGRTQALP